MIKIIEKEGHYIAISSNSNSFNVGKTLEEAYNKAKKDEDNDSGNIIKDNSEQSINIKENLKLFFIKLTSVFLIIVFILFFTINQISNNIKEQIDKFDEKYSNIGGSRFWSKLEKEIISSAREDNSISEEKKQEIINAIEIHVKNLKPFIDEINKLFED